MHEQINRVENKIHLITAQEWNSRPLQQTFKGWMVYCYYGIMYTLRRRLISRENWGRNNQRERVKIAFYLSRIEAIGSERRSIELHVKSVSSI